MVDQNNPSGMIMMTMIMMMMITNVKILVCFSIISIDDRLREHVSYRIVHERLCVELGSRCEHSVRHSYLALSRR
jgi:hypothetical protein